MSDYAALKVPELKKLLQEKSLPITGNKADLIARLQEHDKSQEKPEEQPKAAATGKAFLLFFHIFFSFFTTYPIFCRIITNHIKPKLAS